MSYYECDETAQYVVNHGLFLLCFVTHAVTVTGLLVFFGGLYLIRAWV